MGHAAEALAVAVLAEWRAQARVRKLAFMVQGRKPNLTIPMVSASGQAREVTLKKVRRDFSFNEPTQPTRSPFCDDLTGEDAPMPDKPLSEEQRKQAFFALVHAQDNEMDVAQSRLHVAARYGVSHSQLREIEREGLDNHWPPL